MVSFCYLDPKPELKDIRAVELHTTTMDEKGVELTYGITKPSSTEPFQGIYTFDAGALDGNTCTAAVDTVRGAIYLQLRTFEGSASTHEEICTLASEKLSKILELPKNS